MRVRVTKDDLQRARACASAVSEIERIFGEDALERGVAITRANLQRIPASSLSWLLLSFLPEQDFAPDEDGVCRCLVCATGRKDARIAAVLEAVAYAD